MREQDGWPAFPLPVAEAISHLAGHHAGVASEDADFIAERAYQFADAMLAERKKGSTP